MTSYIALVAACVTATATLLGPLLFHSPRITKIERLFNIRDKATEKWQLVIIDNEIRKAMIPLVYSRFKSPGYWVCMLLIVLMTIPFFFIYRLIDQNMGRTVGAVTVGLLTGTFTFFSILASRWIEYFINSRFDPVFQSLDNKT